MLLFWGDNHTKLLINDPGSIRVLLEISTHKDICKTPNSVMMERCGIKRRETYAKHLKTLEDNNLINVNREVRPYEIKITRCTAGTVHGQSTDSPYRSLILYNNISDLKEISLSAPCGADGKDGNMFFENMVEKAGYEEFDYKCASILAKAVRKNRRVMTKYSLKNWAVHFRKLREVDGVKKGRIKKVLLWYIENMNNKYTPQAFAGESFRKKFIQIEASYEKSIPVKVTLSDDGHKAFEVIQENMSFNWDNENEVKWAVEASINNYKKLLSKLKTDTGNRRLNKLAKFIFDSLAPPVSFTVVWFSNFKTVSNLDNIVFTNCHSMFKRQAVSLAEEYVGDGELWFKLLGVLNEN